MLVSKFIDERVQALLEAEAVGEIAASTSLLQTQSLQLFKHPENSEWFAIIYVIIFEVNIVDEQKQT